MSKFIPPSKVVFERLKQHAIRRHKKAKAEFLEATPADDEEVAKRIAAWRLNKLGETR